MIGSLLLEMGFRIRYGFIVGDVLVDGFRIVIRFGVV